MDMLTGFYNAFSSFTDWVWGIPILIVLVGGGIVLAVVVEGIQFLHLPFIFKTTLGSLGEKKSSDGISPLKGMIAALSATIGTGNIVGVGTAIAMGGPGALFWMWVCGFMAMGIKYSEVTLSCVYRQPDGKGGYKGGPFMYIRDGVKSKGMAVLFGIMMLVCLSLICSVHSSAITSNLASIGVPSIVSCIVMAAFIIIVIWGGMRTLVKITDKLVPVMGVLYLILALIVIIANIGNIGTVFVSIFEGAFSGWAAVGGFTGATIATTIRYGLARGVFSNDAGLGLSATVQSQMENIGCPAKQGSWAVIETFLDTIVICTITGFVILFSGTWQSGGTGATLTTGAIGEVVGTPGQVLAIICLFLFGLSSLITDAEGVRLQAVSMFGSYGIGRGFQIVVLILVILGSLADISTVFVFADFANAIILVINIAAMLMLSKVLRKETQEYFKKKNS